MYLLIKMLNWEKVKNSENTLNKFVIKIYLTDRLCDK